MYLELTPADTLRDLQNLLIDALPGFEFPRKDLYDYTIQVVQIPEDEVLPDDFILGIAWSEIIDENLSDNPNVLPKAY